MSVLKKRKKETFPRKSIIILIYFKDLKEYLYLKKNHFADFDFEERFRRIFITYKFDFSARNIYFTMLSVFK